MTKLFNRVIAFISLTLLMGISSHAFAGEFEGTWLLYDTQGGGYEATLSQDGSASGTHGDSLKHGTWKQVDGAAVISWDTGWTTRISKQGKGYVKTSFKPGVSLTDKPTDTSEARKKN